jgi:hypothetical protein
MLAMPMRDGREVKMALYQWQALDSTGNVQMLTYSFGPGEANTLAVRLDDGSFLVVSPASNAGEGVLDELGKLGTVSALLAPNGFHHMGQAQWRKRFPEAVSYAPADAIGRVAKKSGIAYQPVSELQGKLGPHVHVVAPLGLKNTDLLVHASTPEGAIWFGGDLISNQQPGEGSLIFRALSALAGGGPGYRFNPLPAMLYLKDKKAWKADVRERMGRERLLAVVPAHGHVATGETVARTQEILA